MKIVFFGTPEFAVASLKALLDNGFEVSAVVTAPDKEAGRGHRLLESDVKKFAVERGLPLLQPVKLRDPEFIARLREIDADLFVVIAFRMLPEMVWSMPHLGTFNLHASLLPKFRGAAPINHAIIQGEKETGVTTFFLQHEIDTGDIIMQRQISIGEDENVGSLHDRLMAAGGGIHPRAQDFQRDLPHRLEEERPRDPQFRQRSVAISRRMVHSAREERQTDRCQDICSQAGIERFLSGCSKVSI